MVGSYRAIPEVQRWVGPVGPSPRNRHGWAPQGHPRGADIKYHAQYHHPLLECQLGSLLFCLIKLHGNVPEEAVNNIATNHVENQAFSVA